MALDKKTVLLVRHAHRDLIDQEKDNGLSEQGKLQAKNLAQTLAQEFTLNQPLILVSPKVRCVETLEPLSQLSGSPLRSDPRLLEQASSETEVLFRKRIEDFVHLLFETPEKMILICSHGDWLPIAMEFLVQISYNFKKCEWVELSLDKTQAQLKSRMKAKSL